MAAVPAEFEEGSKLRGLADALGGKRTKQILTAIGAYLTARSQAAFKDQSFGGVAWPERHVPNIAGIVSDLNAGATNPKRRRFVPRPALVDTGALRRSISWQVQGSSVVVGTALPYASVHQVGGVTKPIPLTFQGKVGLIDLLHRKPKLRESLGFLFQRPIVFSKVPARPFVGLQDGDIAEIERIIAADLSGGL